LVHYLPQPKHHLLFFEVVSVQSELLKKLILDLIQLHPSLLSFFMMMFPLQQDVNRLLESSWDSRWILHLLGVYLIDHGVYSTRENGHAHLRKLVISLCQVFLLKLEEIFQFHVHKVKVLVASLLDK
jgi:hypothetical protein